MRQVRDTMDIAGYRGLIDHSPIGYFLCGLVMDQQNNCLDYEFLEVNRAFEALAGLPQEKIVGRRRSDVFQETEEGFRYWLKTYAEVALGGEEKEIKAYSHTLGGYFKEYIYSPQKGYFAGLITDITLEVKETEEKNLILHTLNEMIFEFDEDYVFTQVIVDKEKELFFPREKIIGASLQSLYPKEMAEDFIEKFEAAKASGNREEITYPSLLEDSEQWFKGIIKYIEKDEGNRYLVQITDITEKKKLEDEIRVRNQQIEDFFAVNPDLLCILDSDQKFLRVNQAFEAVLGYRMDEMEGVPMVDFIHPEDREKSLQAGESLAQEDKIGTFVNRYRKKDGGYRLLEWRVMHSQSLVYAAARDITQRLRLEEELKRTNDRLTEIALHSRTFAWEVDTRGVYTYVNPSVKKVLGYEPEEILGSAFYDYHPEENRKVFRESVFEIFQKKDNIEKLPNPVLKKSGEWLWVSTSAYPIFGEDGAFKGYRGSDTDINESYLIQRALENREEFLSKILKTTHEGFWMLNIEGRIIVANEAYSRMTGYSLGDLQQMSIDDLELVKNEEETRGRIERIMETGFDRFETIHRRKDGSHIDVDVTINLMGGDNPAFICFCRDITEEKQAKKILHNERELFKTTLFSVGDGVISTDREGNVVIINEVASRLTGWSSEEAVGKPLDEIFKIINEDTLEGIGNPERVAIETGQTHEMEGPITLIPRVGDEIAIEVSMAPIRGVEGCITGAVIVFRDFTQKKEKQRQVEFLSFHDYLTGLYNRRYLEDAMVRLDTSRNLPFTLMVLDVNGLKLVNDTFGHDIGDRLLESVASVLRRCIRADDIVARTGGDEFVILLPNTDDEGARNMKDRILESAQNASFGSVIVSVAIGWATKWQQDEDIFLIQKVADDRMYEDKAKYAKTMRNRTHDKVRKSRQDE